MNLHAWCCILRYEYGMLGGSDLFCCHHAMSFLLFNYNPFFSLTTVTVSRMACKYLYNSVIRTVFSVLQKLAMSVPSTFRLLNPSMQRNFFFTLNTPNMRKQRANLASTFLYWLAFANIFIQLHSSRFVLL